MVALTWIEHHGLRADGHDLDPDKVMALALAALAADTDLKPLARREALPANALPVEAWWGTYVVDNPGSQFHGMTLEGIVPEGTDGARPVTVVNLPGQVAHAGANR